MPRTLQTVNQAVTLLELFDADHTEWTLSELSRRLNQPTSTVHEQLVTLTRNGLLVMVGRGKYRLGWRLLKLSSALYGSVPWYAPAHEAMNALARGTHALAFLSVVHGLDVLCIARSVQGREGESVVGETQFNLPPDVSASGKLLYALSGLSDREEIRSQGWAGARDEWQAGTSGLAVPIHGSGGEVVCALGISFPTARWREHEKLLRQLQNAASEVSWRLGWRKASQKV